MILLLHIFGISLLCETKVKLIFNSINLTIYMENENKGRNNNKQFLAVSKEIQISNKH